MIRRYPRAQVRPIYPGSKAYVLILWESPSLCTVIQEPAIWGSGRQEVATQAAKEVRRYWEHEERTGEPESWVSNRDPMQTRYPARETAANLDAYYRIREYPPIGHPDQADFSSNAFTFRLEPELARAIQAGQIRHYSIGKQR